jgi:hypothetical protein
MSGARVRWRRTPAAAEHGFAPDAALRSQDRSFFESWNRPERFPDLLRRRG